ncbi:hypothetical protein [Archaeoglobus fulgidus]|jgi:hypothetical protein|uniref:Uncharacterized protein AF_1213 n=3 Tax=Archaeoglobus fulgidus TaxID=2234 RepID=Y1213_ARCFU|nr:hypothetical protein [Archaeoglobus fulgidus]O29055.1 RecName: Full=Uncharacterized protein AF_1213 [Archaeoglobus fulgidus DSM 4304]AAB90034.1 predicted coding region AF_1213 [Archaeoglobus fulgidus DSM 4304]AIG98087.1 hypothetical protein AFULGI_00013120 [Archaeoglobus fulgidus DSM 8774]KUJ93665.1 MAG: hypothetical protein XD40_1137 [Archaeoglobus fulgidus]KUK06145.1 MAG: Uncharacterized protein XD48_1640 [Archaeoglobus fulgidus]
MAGQLTFKRELEKVFEKELKKRIERIGKTPLSPLSLILFTRIAELSAIENGYIRPTEYEMREIFAARTTYSEGLLSTLKDIIYSHFLRSNLGEHLEDFIYTLQRIEDIQSKIDELILREMREVSLRKVYHELLRFLLDMLCDKDMVRFD